MDIDNLVEELLVKHEFAQKHKIAYKEVNKNWRYICPCSKDELSEYDIVNLDGKLWKHRKYTTCCTNALAQHIIARAKDTYAKFIDFRSEVKMIHCKSLLYFIPHVYWRNNIKDDNNGQH